MSGHGLHAGTLLGPALLLAFWAGWSDLRAWMHRSGGDLAPGAALLAAALSVGAATIHTVVVPAHLAEGPAYAGFFLLLAVCQIATARALVLRPSSRAFTVCAVGNLAVIGLWLVTRTAGLPFVAVAIEPVGVLDLTCSLLEVGVVACCVALRRSPVGRCALLVG